jgi:hypothetical protein
MERELRRTFRGILLHNSFVPNYQQSNDDILKSRTPFPAESERFKLWQMFWRGSTAEGRPETLHFSKAEEPIEGYCLTGLPRKSKFYSLALLRQPANG